MATPAGAFPLRRVMYRADKLVLPKIKLQTLEITPELGWCDDPNDSSYNRLVRLPFLARHEKLWRDDGLYDLIAEVGYNDDPVTPGKGSAIFMHVAANDYQPTAGCVALARNDLLQMLCDCEGNDRLIVNP